MEPLFPVLESARKRQAAWLAVGASFPELPVKRHSTASALVSAPLQPALSPKPESSAPPSLSNYREYELVDREGLVQVLKWQVDFGSPTLRDFGQLAGFEVPRYVRSSKQVIGGKAKKATQALIAQIDTQLGLKNAEKPRKIPRIHDIKWTSSPEFHLESAQNGPELIFLQRSRTLNSLLATDPKDVSSWLELVSIQEKSIEGKMGRRQIAEKQICILDKALERLNGEVSEGDLEKVLRKVVELGRNHGEVSIWNHSRTYARSVTYWKYAIYLENCQFETFSMTKLRETFAKAALEVPFSPEMNSLRVQLVGEQAKYELLVGSRQAGYGEISTALLQALLMRTFLPYSPQELRKVWDSESPRLGEEIASDSPPNSPISSQNAENLSEWAESETKAANWRPVKASSQAERADLQPNSVVLSDDLLLAVNSVAGEVTSEVQKAALSVFLRHWKMEICCSGCKSDFQLLEGATGLFAQVPVLSTGQLQYLVSTFAALLPLYAGREVRQWLIALEKQQKAQFWTRQILSNCEDFGLWVEFAYNSDQAWNLLRTKALSASPTQKLLFFYHSFLRITQKTTLKAAISELTAAFETSETLSALCAAKAAAHVYESEGTFEGNWAVQRVAEATALWLLYWREGLEVAWSYFQTVLEGNKVCRGSCEGVQREWVCEQAAGLLDYHEGHTHVYMKTDLTEKYAQLLSVFPRNPGFCRAYSRLQAHTCLSLTSLHVASEYHSALLFPTLQTWQQALVLSSLLSSGSFPSHPCSFLYLWEQWIAGKDTESRALTALRHLPFCKSLYVAAARAGKKPEDFIAALSERELHLRVDPLQAAVELL